MSRSEIRLRAQHLSPERTPAGELAGLRHGDDLIPFPGLGLETELGVVVPGAGGRVSEALGAVLEARGGLPAAPGGRSHRTWIEADRQFHPWGASYQEGDHLEINTFLHRGAAGARRNLEVAMDAAAEWAARSGANVILHANGEDGQGQSWSSLHVNTPISTATYRQIHRDQRLGPLAYTWYLPAQVSLHAVDGNGGVGKRGFLISDRAAVFDRVFGAGTLRPARAMVVDRAEGFGCARNMGMLRGLSFGAGSVAGLAATQIDCLLLGLQVHDVLDLPPLRLHDPVAASAHFARVENVKQAATLARRAQELRRASMEALARALGDGVAEELVPGWAGHLATADAAIDAILCDDEAGMAAHCDWARKLGLMRKWLARGGRTFEAAREMLVEINVHYARLDGQALRRQIPGTALPEGAGGGGIPEDTSSWLLHWLMIKAAADPAWWSALHEAEVSWAGVSRERRTWMEPQGGAWPWARRTVRRIDLVPSSFTKKSHGALCASARDLDELLEAAGREETTCGDWSGRRYEDREGTAS